MATSDERYQKAADEAARRKRLVQAEADKIAQQKAKANKKEK